MNGAPRGGGEGGVGFEEHVAEVAADEVELTGALRSEAIGVDGHAQVCGVAGRKGVAESRGDDVVPADVGVVRAGEGDGGIEAAEGGHCGSAGVIGLLGGEA